MANRTKTYLLTGGLVPLLENRYGVPLNDTVRAKVRRLEKEYAQEIDTLLGRRRDKDNLGEFLWDIAFVDDLQIDQDLRGLVIGSKRNLPLVSFDDVYCKDLADAHYSITRLADPSDLSKESVSGPRLGFPNLDEQVSTLRVRCGREIDLMDIGTFGGGTISDEIMGRLKANGIRVNNVFLVFAGEDGIKKINATGSKLHYLKSYDWVDWLEMRDCIGLDGRKVIHSPSTKQVHNAFIRYCDKATDWASVPEQFRERFVDLYSQYFQKVRETLKEAGAEIELTKSSANPLVYELGIKR